MKYLSHAFVFIEFDNRLFAHQRHFAHYQNPLSPGLHNALASTDCGAKSRPDGGVLLRESSMQVVSNVSRILAREKDNEDSTTFGKKIEMNMNQRKIFRPREI